MEAEQDDGEGGFVVHKRFGHIDPFSTEVAVGGSGDGGEIGEHAADAK